MKNTQLQSTDELFGTVETPELDGFSGRFVDGLHVS